MRILVIDDDVELASLLQEFLQREGCCAGRNAPGHGFEILRRLRQQCQIPVLMLTARGEDVDRIVGLELGADDYLPKPFNPGELSARIRAILRRADGRTSTGKLEVNGIVLDPGTREVYCDSRKLEVTTIEFDILEQLMRAAGRVLLPGCAHGNALQPATPHDRAMDMHISHLRKKLETGGRKRIKTVRGIGYQFVRTAEDAAE